MRVYHYLPAKWAFRDLQHQRLKLAVLTDLNDPFDLLCYDLRNREMRQPFKATRDELASRTGMLCFSRTWKNPVLWSHYADKHRGICLGFDAPDSLLVPVTYTAVRLPLDPDSTRLDLEFATQWIKTKYDGWAYEEEVRVFATRTDGPYMNFEPNLVQREVIAGPLCPYSARLRAAMRTRSDDVELVRSRLAFRSFEVVRDQRGFGADESGESDSPDA